MRKIPTLFERNEDHLVVARVAPTCEWVLGGEGAATIKYDGTACLFSGGKLYKRYTRKPHKEARETHAHTVGLPWTAADYKPAPEGFVASQPPIPTTGKWPGWVPVNGTNPSDQWHIVAWENYELDARLEDGKTYELIGPKINANPYDLDEHRLVEHGADVVVLRYNPPTFQTLQTFLQYHELEGLVFWHPDGRLAKIKRRDYGFPWPVTLGEE